MNEILQELSSARHDFGKIAEIATRAKSNRWKIAAGFRPNVNETWERMNEKLPREMRTVCDNFLEIQKSQNFRDLIFQKFPNLIQLNSEKFQNLI